MRLALLAAALAALVVRSASPASAQTGSPTFAPLAGSGGSGGARPVTSPTPGPTRYHVTVLMEFYAKGVQCTGTSSFNETYVTYNPGNCSTSGPLNPSPLVTDPISAWVAYCYVPLAAGSDVAPPALSFSAWQNTPTCPPSVANGAQQAVVTQVGSSSVCQTTLFTGFDVLIYNECPSAASRLAAPGLVALLAAAAAVAALGGSW